MGNGKTDHFNDDAVVNQPISNIFGAPTSSTVKDLILQLVNQDTLPPSEEDNTCSRGWLEDAAIYEAKLFYLSLPLTHMNFPRGYQLIGCLSSSHTA